jgi:ABC-type antimicrobial peptide transport system permease subunit
MALVGTAIGVAGAVALSHWIQGLLFGVTATDPVTFAAAAACLVFAGLAAAYLPARRASRINPVVLLR